MTLLAANLAVRAAGLEVVETPTAADLEREALARAAPTSVLMAAAVADYRPAEPGTQAAEGRRAGRRARADADVLARSAPQASAGAGAGRRSPRSTVTGLERGARKRDDKGVDLIVFNDVGPRRHRLRRADNEVTLVSRRGERHVPKAPKRVIAAAILDEVERLLNEKRG